MQERIGLSEAKNLYPSLPNALYAITRGIKDSGLNARLVELLKVRASQINGCAFCLNMHLQEARQAGEDQQRLDTLAAWREASFYNEREQAALEWCETLTRLPAGSGPDDALYQRMRELFSAEEIMAVTATVVLINSWNRVVMALRFTTPRRSP